MKQIKYTNRFLFSFFLMLMLFLASCSTKSTSGCGDGEPCIPSNGPHQMLSDYGFFKGEMKNLEPIESLLPYDLNTELFSDYSQKLRLVYVPEDRSISAKNGNELGFPVGSVLVKNFFYDHNMKDKTEGRTILETRLLIHHEEGWAAETYVWNDDQTEAVLHRTGDSEAISWRDEKGVRREVNYRIPSVNDCRNCHGGNNELAPLGPTIRNLNKLYSYKNGTANQIARWREKGFLPGNTDPGNMPKLPAWDDPSTGTIDQRARAYLHVNCANCHTASGSASNSTHFLEYEQDNPFHLGIYKTPVAAGQGSGNLKYIILPGNADESILRYRMESVQPQVRMPEIGRTVVHEEAVKLIREWIDTLDLPADNEKAVRY